MHETSADLNTMGIAHATIRLIRDDEGSVHRIDLVTCNDVFRDQTGLDPDVGDAFLREAFGMRAAAALAEIVDAARTEAPIFTQYFQSTARWFSCYGSRVDDETLALALVDVTSYRLDSAFVQLREKAYRSFIEHLAMIAFLRVVKPEPVPLFTAGSFREITGYGPEQGSTPERWLEIVHPEDRERVRDEADRLYTVPGYDDELEYRIVRSDGTVRWVHSYDRSFASDDGSMQLVQGLIQDVTERKQQEDALRDAHEQIQEQNRMLARLARTDALTGLLNRRAMQEQLERELRLFSRGRGTFSILLIDLDHFKAVNDRHGHRAGDRVLMSLAETLSEHVRASDIQARWGGEEFLVLFTGTPLASALPVAEKLRRLFAEHPTRVDETDVHATFTGGLVEVQTGDTVDSLFARADHALYDGKRAGRNRISTSAGPASEESREE